LVSAAFVGTFALTRLWGQDGLPTSKELFDLMTQANRRLQHVEVHFEAWEEELEGGSWRRTAYEQRGVAWLNGQARSKGRINFARYTERWTQGTQPVIESSFDVAFDGTEGTMAEHFMKHSGRTAKSRRGVISAQPAPRLFKEIRSQVATGQIFAAAFCGDAESSLPEMLARYERDGVRFAIQKDVVEGRDALKLIAGDANADYHAWWIDPERSYALLRHEVVADGTLKRRIQVTNLTEAAPGVWYPTEGHYQRSLIPETAKTLRLPETSLYQYRASKVVANAPDFDEKIYRITFSPGYSVDDQIRGRQYRVAPSEPVLQSELDSIANQTLAQLTPEERSLSRPPADAAHPRLAVPLRLYWVVIGCTAAVPVGAIGLFLARRRWRGWRAAVIILGLPALVFAVEPVAPHQPQIEGPDTDSATESLRENCGVNVTYLALRLFGFSAAVGDVAKDLGVGPSHEKLRSFADIKRVLARRSLEVQGLRADTLEGVLNWVTPGRIVTLKLSDSPRQGHFVLLVASGDDVIVVDPPYQPRRLPRSDAIRNQLLLTSTNEFLVITRAALTQGSGLVLPQSVIDAGELPYLGDVAVVEVPVANAGTNVLRITDVRGDCSCFAGFEGDLELTPGERGELRIRMKKELLPEAGQRQFAIITDHPSGPAQVVTVRFTRHKLPTPQDVVIAPRRIDMGRGSARSLQARSWPIRVSLPPSWGSDADVRIEASGKNLRVDLRPADCIDADDDGRRILVYSVSWTVPPQDTFSELLRIEVIPADGAPVQTMTIPVRGDAVQ
jgi:hypothetical protein